MPSYKAAEPVSRPDYVEAGEYTVEVLNADESVSKQGNELIELKLKIEPSGAILYDNLVFTPNAFWKIDAFRLATGEEITPDEEVEITGDGLIGRIGRARLIVEEYNGRKRNKIAAWIPPETPAASAKNGGSKNENKPF